MFKSIWKRMVWFGLFVHHYSIALFHRGTYSDIQRKSLGIGPWQWSEWIRRQRQTINWDNSKKDGKFSLVKMCWYHAWMKAMMTYVKDQQEYSQEEYWSTTDEILNRMEGDCEDQAIAIMYKLRQAGFSDDMIGAVEVTESDGGGHVFAVVYDGSEDFWCLNNGYSAPTRASVYFASNPDKLNTGFNFFDIWSY